MNEWPLKALTMHRPPASVQAQFALYLCENSGWMRGEVKLCNICKNLEGGQPTFSMLSRKKVLI
jgi:hypothetical protein